MNIFTFVTYTCSKLLLSKKLGIKDLIKIHLDFKFEEPVPFSCYHINKSFNFKHIFFQIMF